MKRILIGVLALLLFTGVAGCHQAEAQQPQQSAYCFDSIRGVGTFDCAAPRVLLASLETGAPEMPPAEKEASEPDLGDALKQLSMIKTTWKEVGWLAGLTALVTLVITLTKLKILGEVIRRNKLQWVRPLLAMVLAGLGSAGLGAIAGIDLSWIIVGGLLAGLMSPGLYQFIKAFQAAYSPKKRAELQAKAGP